MLEWAKTMTWNGIKPISGSVANELDMQLDNVRHIPISFLTNLSSGDEKGYVESAAPLPTLKRLIEKTANDLSLFKEYSFETFQAQNMDFVLKIEMLNHGSAGKAAGAGLITGLTLFVIPSVAKDNYTLTGKVYDKSGKLLKTYT